MMKSLWEDKTVMITGVAGTVGQELLRQLQSFGTNRIVGIDNNESEIFFLDEQYRGTNNAELYLCDLRDRESLQRRMQGVEIVIHSAALKHVGLCEQSPRSAVSTNIIGTQNVIDSAFACNVQRVLLTSSDKAVNPTNVMGTSKLMGERLMTAANTRGLNNGPIFASTRFGNVLGSRGSVIPLFHRQIRDGGPVTLTSHEMTRFIMTLEEAVRLVLRTALAFMGGEVFITKMQAIRIPDLAAAMIEELAPRYGYSQNEIALQDIGARPGEKMYEELMNDEECRHALESDEFFIVLPALQMHENPHDYKYAGIETRIADGVYTSAITQTMSRKDLQTYLRTNKLLEAA